MIQLRTTKLRYAPKTCQESVNPGHDGRARSRLISYTRSSAARPKQTGTLAAQPQRISEGLVARCRRAALVHGKPHNTLLRLARWAQSR
jgi:hypothetical protein